MATVFLDAVFKMPPGDPTHVAEAYAHALLGRYPRARYLVGTDARAVMLLQALPEWVSDWVVRKLMPIANPQAATKNKN